MSEDRRVQRTRKLLREALMSLILEKGYDAITVQDITDRANLGRATLYLHYRDKEDLLYTSLEETVDELKALVEAQMAQGGAAGQESPFKIAFCHAAEHVALYRVLLSGQGTAQTLVRLRDYIASIIEKFMLEAWPGYNGAIPVPVLSHYIAGALIMLVEWWLRSNMPYSPEEMTGMFERMTREGLRAATGSEMFGGPEATTLLSRPNP